ncbi:hypothetical protein Tco_0636161, partial [Tanacetum coccineum]
MSTHEQHTPTIPTSAVRNTGGRSDPQGLEEPMSDEVLRELCDKNYHELLPLIAEKMQKEKEQQDKLNAVKAHLLYGDESGRNPRNHEESHYSQSNTPTALAEPRRRHVSRGRRVVYSIGWEENNKAHMHVLTAATRVPTQREPRCNQGSIITGAHRPEEPADIWRVKTAREVTRNPNQRGTCQTPTKMISLSLGRVRKETLSLLTKTPKEISALEKGKFKAPPPMVTLTEKRDPNKYCEFKADTGHSTDECMQLRRQIEEMIKSGKLSQFIKELKQNDKPKESKKGEMAEKDKPLAIRMVQTWERVAKQRVSQSFSPETVILFSPLEEEDGTKGPRIIEAEMGEHFMHRIYVDGGASSEVLYEPCFIRLRPEIRSQMIPATTPLIGFSGETIWP